jgi:short-subunit dehydrogenase
MNNQKTALLIGNSDGIGLETTRLLLSIDYQVIGLSRSHSPIEDPNYKHVVQDIGHEGYRETLAAILSSVSEIDLCVYFAGTGVGIDLKNLQQETKVFQVNLMGAVIATELVIGEMLKHDKGHFIGLSSVMDVIISPDAPSYSASKAGISIYWEGLALALAGRNVKVSNVRFGFVDTKMADAPYKPFLLKPKQAAEFILDVVRNPRPRATKPLIMGCIAWCYALPIRLKLLLK